MDPRTAELLAENQRKAAAHPRLSKLVRRIDAARALWKSHWLIASIGGLTALIIFSWGYQVVIARPAEMRARAEAEARAVAKMKVVSTTRSAALDECLTKAKAEADAKWNAVCRKRGQRGNCALPAWQTESLQREDQTERNGCLLRHSVATQ
jgi:hypothetical protein